MPQTPTVKALPQPETPPARSCHWGEIARSAGRPLVYGMPRFALTFAAALVAFATAACAVNRRPATSVEALHADAMRLRDVDRATRDSIIERLVRRAARRGDQTVDILLLSGGGSAGAYGAGFLRAWRERTDAPMPTFDLVTGVSTGSLQAPFALRGTASALDTLALYYREAVDRVAPSLDLFFWLRRTGGIVSNKKFERTLADVFNPQLVAELRREFERDRQIVLSTADLDLGIGRLWSLNDALPDTTKASIEKTLRLFRAATAIPGYYPPLVLDGHVHADGGMATNILLPLDVGDMDKLQQRARERGMSDLKVRIWAISNLWIYAPIKITKASNRGNINSRTTTLLFYMQLPQSIASIMQLQRIYASPGGLDVEVRYTTIPESFTSDPDAEELFSRRFIGELEAAGYARGKSSAPWDSVPSVWARPAR